MKKTKKSKKNTWIYVGLGVLALWYLLKKSKKSDQPGGKAPGSNILPRSGNLSTMADEMSTAEAEKINFVPDTSTFADEYKIDQQNCK